MASHIASDAQSPLVATQHAPSETMSDGSCLASKGKSMREGTKIWQFFTFDPRMRTGMAPQPLGTVRAWNTGGHASTGAGREAELSAGSSSSCATTTPHCLHTLEAKYLDSANRVC